jgi:LPS-assembly lipoprotein
MCGRGRLILLLLPGLLLAGCGFHLQQQSSLPPEMATVRLEAPDLYGQFARRLLVLLEQGGVNVTEDDSATAVLQILSSRVRKEILTIGDNARVREYRLRHTVEFTLLDQQGAVLVPAQKLEQSRVISFDETEILGAAQEDEQLRREMSDTLARLVIRRLSTTGA